jgi:hypothetical protein
MENLMAISCNLKIKDSPFYGNQLPEAVSPKTLFEVDRKNCGF